MADFAASGQLSWESSIDGGGLSRMAVEALLLETKDTNGTVFEGVGTDRNLGGLVTNTATLILALYEEVRRVPVTNRSII